MPGLIRDDRVGNHSFVVEVDGAPVSSVSEVRGLRLERDVIELKETAPDGTTVVRRLPGGPRPGDVDLVRRLTDDTSFQRWMRDAHLGEGGSRQGGRSACSTRRAGAVTGYTLTGAWPRCLRDRRPDRRWSHAGDRDAHRRLRRDGARLSPTDSTSALPAATGRLQLTDSTAKVSHWLRSPVLKPWRNQR